MRAKRLPAYRKLTAAACLLKDGMNLGDRTRKTSPEKLLADDGRQHRPLWATIGQRQGVGIK